MESLASGSKIGIGTRRVAVLLFPGFPMMAFSAVVEPLRAANALCADPQYAWITVGIDGRSLTASNGITFKPDSTVQDDPTADYIVVCSGGNADQLTAKQPIKWIRKNLRRGAHLGSVADGAFYLARHGLLDGHACTLHWRSQPAFVEAFPQIELKRSVYVIDRTRFTSAGGVGAFDMMLDIIQQHHGETMAQKVAEWFVHDRIRATADREKLQLRLRTGIRNDLVLAAVARMEERMERGETIARIAKRLGISVWKLDRAFRADLKLSPGDYFRQMRMERASDLLIHSSLPIHEVGLACGYTDYSAFVRAFRRVHRKTPAQLRR
ncbi:GlxA family transcriptional regulator [Dongia sedimenti]|uniref:GlxA family transcriptional regulator n=1 Tax=Dongia sedimenti TaxID=3064282 RepID=A0ABU0YRS6_9PROT|nr:GlxA family transcriptional regulator [Rhodospirillaceae bacterium R-7]